MIESRLIYLNIYRIMLLLRTKEVNLIIPTLLPMYTARYEFMLLFNNLGDKYT